MELKEAFVIVLNLAEQAHDKSVDTDLDDEGKCEAMAILMVNDYYHQHIKDKKSIIRTRPIINALFRKRVVHRDGKVGFKD